MPKTTSSLDAAILNEFAKPCHICNREGLWDGGCCPDCLRVLRVSNALGLIADEMETLNENLRRIGDALMGIDGSCQRVSESGALA